jgi:hypothetical protein
MNKQTKDAIERTDKARNFPTATCAASRHAQMIGEHLARQQPYPMLTEEPDHCGVSILSTVASLWEARAEIERLRAKLEAIDDYYQAGGELTSHMAVMAREALGDEQEVAPGAEK